MDLRTIELKIARGENLPILPQVVSAAFKMADDPRCTPNDLEKLIHQDSALTAKILRVVNSAMFGVSNVTSIGRTLSVIGTNRVRSLITSFALQNLVNDREQSSRFNKLEYWRHSLAVATTGRLIAKQKLASKSEDLYVAGLLHDIGLLVLDKFCPDQLDAVIQFSLDEGCSLSEAEAELMDFSHAGLGGFLVRRWGIGEYVATTVENHHLPVFEDGHTDGSLILMAANAIAHEAGYSNQASTAPYDLDPELLERLDLTTEMIEDMKAQMQMELAQTEKTFAISASSERVVKPVSQPQIVSPRLAYR